MATLKKLSGSSKKVTKKESEFELYKTINYAEEYQNTGFHYAFMSADNKMCHHWVKCRDFLQDALRNQLTGRADSIYSFHYKPDEDPKVDTKTTRILVKRQPTPVDDKAKVDFDEMIKSSVMLLNHYEKAYKFKPRSKVMKIKHSGPDQYVYLFKGPGVWSQGPVMISIYTFLIRLGYFKPVFKDETELMAAYEGIIASEKQTNDTKYLKIVYKNLHKALEERDKHLFKKKGWKAGDKVLFHGNNMSSFHHNSGIVSLSQFKTPIKKLNDEFVEIFKQKK